LVSSGAVAVEGYQMTVSSARGVPGIATESLTMCTTRAPTPYGPRWRGSRQVPAVHSVTSLQRACDAQAVSVRLVLAPHTNRPAGAARRQPAASSSSTCPQLTRLVPQVARRMSACAVPTQARRRLASPSACARWPRAQRRKARRSGPSPGDSHGQSASIAARSAASARRSPSDDAPARQPSSSAEAIEAVSTRATVTSTPRSMVATISQRRGYGKAPRRDRSSRPPHWHSQTLVC
jgi:hypothetical protein